MILEGLAVLLLSMGCVFLVLGSIGVIRFPDFYCRTHAMSKPDTMGIILAMTGMALLNGWDINSLKLILVVLFAVVANPAAAHALGRAAMKTGLEPWGKNKDGEE